MYMYMNMHEKKSCICVLKVFSSTKISFSYHVGQEYY